MAEAGVYYVSVVPDMSKFNSALDKGAARSKSIFGRIASIGIGTALGGALSKGIDMFVSTLDSGISRLDTLSTFPKVLANVGIDAEASARAIDTLSKGIDGLPTTLDAAASATQRFALQTGDVEGAADMFLALNNAILAGGQSADMQASALEQVSQAYAKGQPDMVEWRTMTMTMGPALQMVAQSWGMSVDEMGEALRNGDKSMDDFMGTIQQLNTDGIGDFKSLSEQASVSTQTIGTAMANVGNRMGKAWTTILEAIGQERIAGAINAVSSSFGVLAEAVAPIVGEIADNLANFIEGTDFSFLTDGINALVTAFQPLADSLLQFVTGQGPAFQGMMERIGDHLTAMGPAWSMLVEAVGNFAAAAAPIATEILGYIASAAVALVPIITTLAAGFVQLVADILKFVTMVASNIPKIPSYFSSMVSSVKGYFTNLISTIQSIPSRIVGFFEGLGGRISSAIGSIHFPTPHVSWETVSVAGAKTPFKLPHVSWYAQGGMVNGAQIIGVGERGTELIWPSYGNALDKYASAIVDHMGDKGGNVTEINVYMDNLRINDDEAIRNDVISLVTDMRRLSQMNRG